jgi:hypothetical protein
MSNQDTFAAFTGVQLEVIAAAIAQAIAQSRKFNKAEHGSALRYIVANSAPASLAANVERIGNISAISQDLAKAGLVQHGEPSALARSVGAEIDKLAEQAKAQAKKAA